MYFEWTFKSCDFIVVQKTIFYLKFVTYLVVQIVLSTFDNKIIVSKKNYWITLNVIEKVKTLKTLLEYVCFCFI